MPNSNSSDNTRQDAQRRVDDIRVFQVELAALEAAAVITLTDTQRNVSSGIGLIVVVNAVVFLGIGYNRKPPAESEMLLTERELATWPGMVSLERRQRPEPQTRRARIWCEADRP
jgi:hypothetical protein